MMEKQILIVVASADLALTTIGCVAIVLYAMTLLIAAAVLLWKTISAVYRHSRRRAHGMSSASNRRSVHNGSSANVAHNITSTTHFPCKSRPEGRRKSE